MPIAPCAWAVTKLPFGVCGFDHSAHLRFGQFGLARLGADGKHRAGGDHLDEVGTVRDQIIGLFCGFLGRAG